MPSRLLAPARRAALTAAALACLPLLAGASHTRRVREAPAPDSLFPGKILELPPGTRQVVGHFYRVLARKGDRGALRLRVKVHDPDGTVRALRVRVDGGAPQRLDRTGVVAAGAPGAGFADEDETGYVNLRIPPRHGPHQLLLEVEAREGARDDRARAQVRVLGAVFFDAVGSFRGIHDLGDLLHRRYRDLREFDLQVRRFDPRNRGDLEHRPIYDHWGEAEQALYRQTTVAHFGLLNELTFRAHRTKVDPVAWVNLGMARFHLVFEPWMHAPKGGRASYLYSASPNLYEYLDEVSLAFQRARDAYFSLAGMEAANPSPEDPAPRDPFCDLAPGNDPLRPTREVLAKLETALERLIEAAAMIHEELEARAFDVAGDPETTLRDFPAAERTCRMGRTYPVHALEARSYRAYRAGIGEIRGVRVAEGNPCCKAHARRRGEREIVRDRLRPEREKLAEYLTRIREVAHHDLHLVRMWKVLMGFTPPERLSVPAPKWIPTGGVPTLRAGNPLEYLPGASRVWKKGGGRIRSRLVVE